MVKIAGEFRDSQSLRQTSSRGDAMCGQGSAGTATVKTVPHPAEGASNSGELVVRRAGESELPVAKDHRGSSRRVRDAGPKPVHPRPLTTPGSKSGYHARALRRTDSRPRIVLLQSLVGINQGHGRMTTGVRSTHLSRCPAPARHPSRMIRPALDLQDPLVVSDDLHGARRAGTSDGHA